MSVDDDIELPSETVTYLQELYERNGEKLTADLVLDDARRKASPLHDHFEWDDKIAAHEYRLEQARLLLRVTVQFEKRPTRAFVYVRSTGSYHPTARAFSNADWRAEVLADFERDAENFRARWENHKYAAAHYARWVKQQAKKRR